jgi:hypothetical protein
VSLDIIPPWPPEGIEGPAEEATRSRDTCSIRDAEAGAAVNAGQGSHQGQDSEKATQGHAESRDGGGFLAASLQQGLQPQLQMHPHLATSSPQQQGATAPHHSQQGDKQGERQQQHQELQQPQQDLQQQGSQQQHPRPEELMSTRTPALHPSFSTPILTAFASASSLQPSPRPRRAVAPGLTESYMTLLIMPQHTNTMGITFGGTVSRLPVAS